MGMHRLGEIVAIFKQFNQNEKPIAIIQNGSAKDEKVVIGTIENIVAMAEKAQIGSPAIIVVGEVVKSPLPPEGNISTQVSCRRIYDKLS
jgi:uroporphyrin-III C-methyltransferase